MEAWKIELRTPVCKASGLHIHYNMATTYGYLQMVLGAKQLGYGGETTRLKIELKRLGGNVLGVKRLVTFRVRLNIPESFYYEVIPKSPITRVILRPDDC